MFGWCWKYVGMYMESVAWLLDVLQESSFARVWLVMVLLTILMIVIGLLVWFHKIGSHKTLMWSIGMHKSIHEWQPLATSPQPKYCNGCGGLISGFWIFRSSGLVCILCGHHCHQKCIGDCEHLACKYPDKNFPEEASEGHTYVRGNLPPDAVCHVCGIHCSSSFGLYGFRCLWCNRTCHEECKDEVDPLCDLGPFRRLIVPPWAVTLAAVQAQPSTHRNTLTWEAMSTGFKDVKDRMSVGLREGMQRMKVFLKDPLSKLKRRKKKKTGKGSLGGAPSLERTVSADGGQTQQEKEKEAKDPKRRTVADPGAWGNLNWGARQESGGSTGSGSREATKGGGDGGGCSSVNANSPGTDSTGPIGGSVSEKETGHPLSLDAPVTVSPSIVAQQSPVLLCEDERGREGGDEFSETDSFSLVSHGPNGDGDGELERDDDLETDGGEMAAQLEAELQQGAYTSLASAFRREVDVSREKPGEGREGVVTKGVAVVLGGDGIVLPENGTSKAPPSVVVGEVSVEKSSAPVPATAASASAAAAPTTQAVRKASILHWPWVLQEVRILRRALQHVSSPRPMVAFVNTKSGGQVGRKLLHQLYALLNPVQVIDIQAEKGPGRALELFRKLADGSCNTGNNAAGHCQMRVLVCGGDGTAGWVMEEMHKRYGHSLARPHPPIAMLPLGTGNDLANVLGWGKTFEGDLRHVLRQVENAHVGGLDRWEVTARDQSGRELFRSTFNNYMDVGIAARIALKFHLLRESHPELFRSQLGNKMLYGEVGFRDFIGDFVTNNAIDLSGCRIFCDGRLVCALPEKNAKRNGASPSGRGGMAGLRGNRPNSASQRGLPTSHSVGVSLDSLANAPQLVDPLLRLEGLILINIPSFAGGVKLWQVNEEGQGEFSAPHHHRAFAGLPHSPALPGRVPHHAFPPVHRGSADGGDEHSDSSATTVHRCSPLQGGGQSPFAHAGAFTEQDGDESAMEGEMRSGHMTGAAAVAAAGGMITSGDNLSETDMSGVDAGGERGRRVSNRHTRSFAEGGRHGGVPSPTSAVARSFESATVASHLPSGRPAIGRIPWGNGLAGRTFSRWREQRTDDRMIEMVGVKSLFHLGQVQVGLAEPIKICQGSEIKIELQNDLPMQVDGEPRMMNRPCTLHITYKAEGVVLTTTPPCPTKPVKEAFKTMREVLETAVDKGVISQQQSSVLMKEFRRRL